MGMREDADGPRLREVNASSSNAPRLLDAGEAVVKASASGPADILDVKGSEMVHAMEARARILAKPIFG